MRAPTPCKRACGADVASADRMEMHHHCLKLAFGRAYTAPLDSLTPLTQILDLGTGTGRWAFERA